MESVHRQQEPSVAVGEFEQQCLALFDHVAETGIPLVVTKCGRPVARVVPIESLTAVLAGSLKVLTEDPEQLYSTGETWDAQHIG